MIYLLLISLIFAQSLNASQAQIHSTSPVEELVLNEEKYKASVNMFSWVRLMLDYGIGNTEIESLVKLINTHPKIMRAKDFSEMTCLRNAILRKNLTLTQLFVVKGADLDETISKVDSTLLMTTITNNDKKIAHLLISANASLDKKNNAGHTALMLAASYGYKVIIEMLIAAGAKEAIQNKKDKNKTAMEYAMLGEKENAFISAAQAGRERREQYLIQRPLAHAQLLVYFPTVLAKMVEGYAYSNSPEDLAIIPVPPSTWKL